CPREARRARERLAHLPPELPRAKANPERRDEPEELRVHGVHPRSPHEPGPRQPGEVSDRVQTGQGLDTFGTSKCTEALSRTNSWRTGCPGYSNFSVFTAGLWWQQWMPGGRRPQGRQGFGFLQEGNMGIETVGFVQIATAATPKGAVLYG